MTPLACTDLGDIQWLVLVRLEFFWRMSLLLSPPPLLTPPHHCLFLPLAVNTFNVLSTFIAVPAIEKLGRRALLLGGFGMMGMSIAPLERGVGSRTSTLPCASLLFPGGCPWLTAT